MRGKNDSGCYLVRGKVRSGPDQHLFSYVDAVAQAVETHMVRIGMRDVRRSPTNLIEFRGSTGASFLKSDFGLEENIDSGLIKILTEGSAVAAFYYIHFLGRFAVRWFVPVGLITLLAFFETGLRFMVLPFLAIALVIPFLVTVFIIRWGMKRELIRAFREAEDMIEGKAGSA